MFSVWTLRVMFLVGISTFGLLKDPVRPSTRTLTSVNCRSFVCIPYLNLIVVLDQLYEVSELVL